MMKTIYTAEAVVTGVAVVAGTGENGRGKTTDGLLDLMLRPPAELGGPGDGTNPEQLLAIGWAACLEATLVTAAHRTKLSTKRVADAEVNARVMLVLPDPGAPEFELDAEFDVTLPSVEDPELAAELVRTAHRLCPYSKATRGNVELRLTVNGKPLD
jgi:osmotically inducible protein OsmC